MGDSIFFDQADDFLSRKVVVVLGFPLGGKRTLTLDIEQHLRTVHAQLDERLQGWDALTLTEVDLRLKLLLGPVENSFFLQSVESELAVTASVEDHGNIVLAQPYIEFNAF